MFRIKINGQPQDYKNSCTIATIGNFDGMHIGHMQLVETMNNIASKNHLKRLLITFEPLPLEFFADLNEQNRLPRLSLIRDKLSILCNHGIWNACIDELVILRFTKSIAETSYTEFIENILIKELNVSHLVIGHDFKFGKNRAGNISHLERYGLSLNVVQPFYVDNQRVSSSMIREYARLNELKLVKKYLGRNLQYTSRVIHGNHLGRKFGVPTINLSLSRNKPALWGIYIAYVYIDGKQYNAVASIGKNPTVSDLDTYKLEAHLLNVDLDLYGKVATIEILEFLRHEHKFSNLDDLFQQIYSDLDQARIIFQEKINLKD